MGGLTSIAFAAIAPVAINTVEKTTVTGFIVAGRLILLGGDCRYLLAAWELRLGGHLRTGGTKYEREDEKERKRRAEVRMSGCQVGSTFASALIMTIHLCSVRQEMGQK